MFPGENLFGVVGVVGVCWGSAGLSGAGPGISSATFLRAFAMTFEFAMAFFSVSDGEL